MQTINNRVIYPVDNQLRLTRLFKNLRSLFLFSAFLVISKEQIVGINRDRGRDRDIDIMVRFDVYGI